MRTMPRHDGAQRQRAMRARAAWSNNPRRPALPKSVAARNLEGLVVRDRDRQDRVALVEGDGVRPADRDAQRSVLVGDAHGTLVEGETALRRLLEDVLLDAVGALAAVIVPAHGATSVIRSRRPGRTSFFHRCSSSFLSASASSVMRSTTTVA